MELLDGDEMKKLLMLFIFAASASNAAEKWLEAENSAGGKIILLTEKCNNSEGRMLLSSSKEGKTIRGCWWYFADMVQVVYQDGSTYSYDPTNFIVKESK